MSLRPEDFVKTQGNPKVNPVANVLGNEKKTRRLEEGLEYVSRPK
jgi:hypothetical protein